MPPVETTDDWSKTFCAQVVDLPAQAAAAQAFGQEDDIIVLTVAWVTAAVPA